MGVLEGRMILMTMMTRTMTRRRNNTSANLTNIAVAETMMMTTVDATVVVNAARRETIASNTGAGLSTPNRVADMVVDALSMALLAMAKSPATPAADDRSTDHQATDVSRNPRVMAATLVGMDDSKSMDHVGMMTTTIVAAMVQDDVTKMKVAMARDAAMMTMKVDMADVGVMMMSRVVMVTLGMARVAAVMDKAGMVIGISQ